VLDVRQAVALRLDDLSTSNHRNGNARNALPRHLGADDVVDWVALQGDEPDGHGQEHQRDAGSLHAARIRSGLQSL
jgi:hypothetical protein